MSAQNRMIARRPGARRLDRRLLVHGARAEARGHHRREGPDRSGRGAAATPPSQPPRRPSSRAHTTQRLRHRRTARQGRAGRRRRRIARRTSSSRSHGPTTSTSASVKLTAAAPAPGRSPGRRGADATDDEEGRRERPPPPRPVRWRPVVAQPPPGAVVGSAGLLTVPFTLTFDGDYMKLQRLLKAINGLAKHKKASDQRAGPTAHRRRVLAQAGPRASRSSRRPSARRRTSCRRPTGRRRDATAPAGAAGGATTTAITTNAQGAGR